MEESKKCTLCLQVKPLSEFHKDNYSADKATQRCAQCRRILSNAYRLDKEDGTWESRRKPLMTKSEHQRKRNDYSRSRGVLRTFINATTRAKRFNAFIGLFTVREIKRLYGASCFYCGSREVIGLDHVVPLARGGRHTKGNMVAACLSCNSSKKNKTIMEWKKSDGRAKFLL
jgi:5-methylcytosine-specific restriction endonuclease McrA